MNHLLFDFKVDMASNTVHIDREFAADLNIVWDAFTTAEMLDQWWAPKPYESRTKVMEFKEGGRRFYAMVSPEGQENWNLQLYKNIAPKTKFEYTSVFADKDENPFWPGSEWSLSFNEQNGVTKVSISIYNESQERMQKMIEMGFKEGFTMTLNYLAEMLAGNK